MPNILPNRRILVYIYVNPLLLRKINPTHSFLAKDRARIITTASTDLAVFPALSTADFAFTTPLSPLQLGDRTKTRLFARTPAVSYRATHILYRNLVREVGHSARARECGEKYQCIGYSLRCVLCIVCTRSFCELL